MIILFDDTNIILIFFIRVRGIFIMDVVCSFCGIVGSYNTILNHINCDHPDPEINNFESQSGCNSVQELQESSEVDETDNSKSNIFVSCGNYKQIIFFTVLLNYNI